MVQITFLKPDGGQQTVDADEGMTIMEVAVQNDIDKIEGACGGNLACATCHVYVHPDWWENVLPEDEEDVTEEEEDMLDLAFDVGDYSRLSCQIMVEPELDGLILALPGTKVDW